VRLPVLMLKPLASPARDARRIGSIPHAHRPLVPNALAFLDSGDLLVSETIAGAIYKVSPDGEASVWAADPLLQGDVQSPCARGQTQPFGANGVAIVGDSVFVANSTKALLVRIPLNADGSAGEPESFIGADGCKLAGIDGIASDGEGGLLGVGNRVDSLYHIDASGQVQTLVSGDPLDFPASVSLATLDGQRYAMIANFALPTIQSGGMARPGLLSYGPLP
jgi:hypothetical protein